LINDDRVSAGAGFGTHGHRDMEILMTRLGEGDSRVHDLSPGRHAWLHVARGSVRANGHELDEGDGAAFSGAGRDGARGAAATPSCCCSTSADGGAARAARPGLDRAGGVSARASAAGRSS
jgi:redox-sensitive bicupin YhaK (pirin superfamily)